MDVKCRVMDFGSWGVHCFIFSIFTNLSASWVHLLTASMSVVVPFLYGLVSTSRVGADPLLRDYMAVCSVLYLLDSVYDWKGGEVGDLHCTV